MDQVPVQSHLLAPHTWTLCREGQPSQKDMTQTHTHTQIQKEATTLLHDQILLSHVISDSQRVDQRLSAA